jgi:hypothetical protein
VFLDLILYSVPVKGIGSIISQNGLKKIAENKYENNLRSNNYEICTAAAHCFQNILDAIVLENINILKIK